MALPPTHLYTFVGDDVSNELVQPSGPPACAPVATRTWHPAENAHVLVQDQLGQWQAEGASLVRAAALEHLVRLHPREKEINCVTGQD